ncbi:MAG: preprotein translocase subunit SecE [Oscillospiraceae bacterium]|jgi:preprotein translocase subunit SecE|nr:preprotein translocase subunit SecE [Oscillospiraceae bacterium]
MSKAKDEAVKKISTEPVKKAEKGDKKKLRERSDQWFRDLKAELKKVVWPTRKQIVNNTLVALVVIVASAIVLWGFDKIADLFVQTLITQVV